jgi:hypothetical protein
MGKVASTNMAAFPSSARKQEPMRVFHLPAYQKSGLVGMTGNLNKGGLVKYFSGGVSCGHGGKGIWSEQGELVAGDSHAGGACQSRANDGPPPDRGEAVFAGQFAVVGSVELGTDSPAGPVHLGDTEGLIARTNKNVNIIPITARGLK